MEQRTVLHSRYGQKTDSWSLFCSHMITLHGAESASTMTSSTFSSAVQPWIHFWQKTPSGVRKAKGIAVLLAFFISILNPLIVILSLHVAAFRAGNRIIWAYSSILLAVGNRKKWCLRGLYFLRVFLCLALQGRRSCQPLRENIAIYDRPLIF